MARILNINMTSNHLSAFCTSREAARKLNVSLRTVQLWVDAGILDAWRTEGGHRRITLESIERLLKGEMPPCDIARPLQAISQKLRVLVVEDDEVLLRLYKRQIDSWGLPIHVITSTNGWDALMLIGKASPDLLISDLRMPGMDGFEMIRALTTSPHREGMQIVVVTGLDKDDIVRNGGLPPSVRVFPKPIPFAELRNIAAEILSIHAEIMA